MSSIVVKMLTISPYFWTTEYPYFGFTQLAALKSDNKQVTMCIELTGQYLLN